MVGLVGLGPVGAPQELEAPTSGPGNPYPPQPGACGDPSIIGLVCIASILNESIVVLVKLHFRLHHGLKRDQDTEDRDTKKRQQ